MSLDFFNRKHKMLNMDITHRCPLECVRCGRQTSFRNQGLAKRLLKLVKRKTGKKIILQEPISPLGSKLIKSIVEWN